MNLHWIRMIIMALAISFVPVVASSCQSGKEPEASEMSDELDAEEAPKKKKKSKKKKGKKKKSKKTMKKKRPVQPPPEQGMEEG